MLFREGQRAAKKSSRRLVVLFLVLIAAMVLVTNGALALAWYVSTAGMAKLPAHFVAVNTFLVLFYVFTSCWVEMVNLKGGGSVIAEKAGGRELLDPQNLSEKRVRNVVMEVAVAAGTKPPRIYLLGQEDAINAFAAGWGVNDSAIAVTRGAVERLTRDELQGVVAHEFSHILNDDIRLNMRLIGMVLGLQMLHTFGISVVQAGDDRMRFIPVKQFFGYTLMGVGWLGWIAGRILCASVSRQREFLADASAVEFTRYAEGIGGALKKIAYQQQENRAQIIVLDAEDFAPLFLHYEQFSKWLRTHPPISERLKRLGLPFTQFAEKDNFEKISTEAYMPARLAPEGELSPRLKMTAARWGGIGVLQQENIKGYAEQEDSGIDVPHTEHLLQLKAELRLSREMSDERLTAAILAFWVYADVNDGAKKLWEEIGRALNTQTPFRELQSVQNLAPDVREEAFEILAERAQSFSFEKRDELAGYAHQIFDAQDSNSPVDWLRLAVLTYWLGEFRESMSSRYTEMAMVAPSIALVSSFMADTLGVKQPDAWTTQALTTLGLKGEYSADYTPQMLNEAVTEIHHGTSLFAPKMMQVWLTQWQAEATEKKPEDVQHDVDVFRLMCALLDTVHPTALKPYYRKIITF